MAQSIHGPLSVNPLSGEPSHDHKRDATPTFERRPAASHVAARRPARPEAYRFVDWLAAAGQSWWQVLPLVPPDRHHSPYKSRSAFAAWPGSSPRRGRRCRARGDRRLPRAQQLLDRGLGARSPGGGAIADQVRFEREWGALRAYAAERGVRLLGDVAIYVAPGSVDHRAHPELFQDGRGGGRAARRVHRRRASCGATRCTTGRRCSARGYRWWIERLRADVRALRRGADRPLPRVRGLLGGARRRADRERGSLAARPGARGVRRRASARSGPLPLVAEDLGVITPGGPSACATQLGLPGMVVLQFAFDPRDPHTPHRPENHAEQPGRLHRHPRQRHGPRLVRVAATPAARAGRRRVRARGIARARAVVGADPAGASPRRRGSRWSRPRTCSGWEARRG